MALSRLGIRNRPGDFTWPGFVDALASLLMVFVFVLMVFVLIQANLAIGFLARMPACLPCARSLPSWVSCYRWNARQARYFQLIWPEPLPSWPLQKSKITA